MEREGTSPLMPHDTTRLMQEMAQLPTTNPFDTLHSIEEDEDDDLLFDNEMVDINR